MGNENGVWIMHGLKYNDKNCLKDVKSVISFIEKVGFLPLFANEIKDFSLEEHTCSSHWWSGDNRKDPWIWREEITRTGDVFYGKFFDKKAGFISKKYFPVFANAKRDGYDFDSLWDDEKASRKEKYIMDCFLNKSEYLSNELKNEAGFGKEGMKGFETCITNLQMNSYICAKDFVQRKNKLGVAYGWPVAILTTPENITSYKHITSFYKEDKKESTSKVINKIKENFKDATDEKIKKIFHIKENDVKEN